MSNETPVKFAGWRRIIVLFVFILVATVALGFGLVDAENWEALLKWLGTAYIGSDGVEKGAAAYKARLAHPDQLEEILGEEPSKPKRG